MAQLDLQLDLSADKRKVMNLLKAGRPNAKSVKSIAAETGLTDVEVRQCVRSLIMEHGVLIASVVGRPSGYYLPNTDEEVADATRSLRHRGIMILMRAAKLQKINLQKVFRQAVIEFEEEVANAAEG